jgi:hypothetical protein
MMHDADPVLPFEARSVIMASPPAEAQQLEHGR